MIAKTATSCKWVQFVWLYETCQMDDESSYLLYETSKTSIDRIIDKGKVIHGILKEPDKLVGTKFYNYKNMQ